MNNKLLIVGMSLGMNLLSGIGQMALSLPPPEEIPEEVLRTEIITEARSPLDNKPLTAAEYAELQAKLATSPFPPELSPKVRDIVQLLSLLKFFRIITPF